MFQNIQVQDTGDATTKTNRPYKKLTVKDEAGAEFKVNIFSDFPDFSNIKAGSVIRAKLEVGGKRFNAIFNVVDRKRLKYKVLIGESIIRRGKFIIDPIRK